LRHHFLVSGLPCEPRTWLGSVPLITWVRSRYDKFSIVTLVWNRDTMPCNLFRYVMKSWKHLLTC